MTATLPEPYLIADANDPATRPWRDSPWYDEFLVWMRSQGMDPEITHLVEVFVVDCPFARATTFVPCPDGGVALTEDGRDFQRATQTVLLSSLPPLPESAQ